MVSNGQKIGQITFLTTLPPLPSLQPQLEGVGWGGQKMSSGKCVNLRENWSNHFYIIKIIAEFALFTWSSSE